MLYLVRPWVLEQCPGLGGLITEVARQPLPPADPGRAGSSASRLRVPGLPVLPADRTLPLHALGLGGLLS